MFYSFSATVEGEKVTFTEPNPVKGKFEAIVILTTPLRTDAVSSADRPISRVSHPALQTDNTVLSAGTPSVRTTSISPSPGIRQGVSTDYSAPPPRISTVRGALPVMPSPHLSTPACENLSPLYHDKAKRDGRRNSSAGDIYVDVNSDAFQRFRQGEQIQLVFEKSGTYISSPFILVENGSQLYVNFYQFNEEKPIPYDKVTILSQIFEIQGDLPGYVKVCKPSQMVSKNGGYVINSKGVLLIEGAV
jgi:hypothetical protein